MRLNEPQCTLIAILIFAFLTGMATAAEEHSFILPTLHGDLVPVTAEPGVPVTVVCFLGTECPLVQLYSQRLSEMASEYSAQNVRFVGVNSNRQDTHEDIQNYLKQQSLSFPLLRDEGNVVADQFGATRTPEVFVLDQQLVVRYRGRIDDQYSPGVTRAAATRDDVKLAVDELLAGQPVSVPETAAVGCMIGKVRRPVGNSPTSVTSVTYCNQVSRVLQKHCVECHRQDEIGPFAMDSYENVAGWADTMLETIEDGRMPPWHADTQHGKFSNERVMPENERQILRDWVAAGMPEGDKSELPPPTTFATGWQLPQKPDLILPMRDRAYKVPAEGTVEYQYFVVDPGFTEDKWVTAAQIIPGSRAVVHHAIAFIRPPDGSRFRGVGWLTAYVPGQRLNAMPPGHARKVPAGSRLVFQMHYTTNGSPQEDLTQIGMVFGKAEDITHEVITVIGIDQEFEIPPHAADHEVKGHVSWFPKNGSLLAIMPHMHFRGKRFQLSVEQNGQSTILLNVPRYDFNWQHAYELAEPLPLAEIDSLNFTAAFDNSTDNPFNPDPSQWVNWGDQTWEEMAVAFVEVAEPLSPTGSQPAIASDRESTEAKAARTADREQRIEKFVDEYFRSLDTNGDKLVLRTEVPVSVRNHFWRFDQNNDNSVTREEVRQVAEERIRE